MMPLPSSLLSLFLLLLSSPSASSASVAATSASASASPSLSCGNNLCFSGGFSSGAVLQRAPAAASLYGSAPAGSPAAAPVSVVLEAADGSYSKTFATSLRADGTWKVTLDPRPTGGNYSATLACATCGGSVQNLTLSDLTFGDVYFCAGQSNSWLPIWFTFVRNATSAQLLAGAYSNIRVWRGGLGTVSTTGNWIAPQGPMQTNCTASGFQDNQWCRPRDLLLSEIRPNEPWFFEVPAFCFYFAQYLTDLLGDEAPPLGIMSDPVGGTTVEQWTEFSTQAGCVNATCMCQTSGCNQFQPLNAANCTGNAQLYNGNIEPFVNTTIKGMLWYQGENNAGTDAGNSAHGTGYGCLIAAMLAQFRRVWSATPGTTDPMFPFGFVELADGTDEGWAGNFARLRWAQTANYGVVPNPAMGNTFMAHGYDAGDPWSGGDCADAGCCVEPYVPLGPNCRGDHRGQWSTNDTAFFMGCIHPRTKDLVARRLAQAAFATVYGGNVIAIGPVLSGCTLAGSQLILTFNSTLLRNESVTFSPGATVEAENTALYVLVNNSLPENADAGHHDSSPGAYAGTYANGNEWGVRGWVPVTATRGPGPQQLTVDLSGLGARPTAVRYASGTGGWGAPFQNRMCCGPTVDVQLEPCAPESCPIKASGPGALPAAPFVAAITPAGKCQCLAPTSCDE